MQWCPISLLVWLLRYQISLILMLPYHPLPWFWVAGDFAAQNYRRSTMIYFLTKLQKEPESRELARSAQNHLGNACKLTLQHHNPPR